MITVWVLGGWILKTLNYDETAADCEALPILHLAKRHLCSWLSVFETRSEVLSHQHSVDFQVNNRPES